jgi:uncharacterized protein
MQGEIMGRVRTGAIALTATVCALAATASAAAQEPTLGPDSQWEATDWGFKKRGLQLPAEGPSGKWPTLFWMEGYGGASWGTPTPKSEEPPADEPNAYVRMPDGALMALRMQFGVGPRRDYAHVVASIRGTECSAGQFNLYDRVHAWDGHHIIEWIADQGWSNGRVGMHGESYSGQTAFWTASTQPPALKAVESSLLHSDIYRDIFMPGGVQNYIFPVVWYLQGPNRAPEESIRRQIIPNDEICTFNQTTRTSPNALPVISQDGTWKAVEETDNQWYQAHAATTYADKVKVPFYQQNNWQDEQTGPRAAVLWHFLDPDPQEIVGSDGERRTVVPKKMVMANGGHAHGGMYNRDLFGWFDIWLLDKPDVNGILDDRVVNYFEMRGGNQYTAKKTGDEWPFADTRWTDLWLRDGGRLTRDEPSADEGTATYLSGAPARNWPIGGYGMEAAGVTAGSRNLPDGAVYETAPLEDELAIAGPILLDVHASLAGKDTDFFVGLFDVHPDGRISYIQRGLLRASHRAVDPLRSWYEGGRGTRSGRLIQPYRPHTNPQPVMPGKVERYELEVFPVGHVFRPGHRLMIQITTPPALDGLWGYTPRHDPAAVTIHHSAEHPARLQLPVVEDLTPGTAGPPEGCKVPGGFPCYAPSPLG